MTKDTNPIPESLANITPLVINDNSTVNEVKKKLQQHNDLINAVSARQIQEELDKLALNPKKKGESMGKRLGINLAFHNANDIIKPISDSDVPNEPPIKSSLDTGDSINVSPNMNDLFDNILTKPNNIGGVEEIIDNPSLAIPTDHMAQIAQVPESPKRTDEEIAAKLAESEELVKQHFGTTENPILRGGAKKSKKRKITKKKKKSKKRKSKRKYKTGKRN